MTSALSPDDRFRDQMKYLQRPAINLADIAKAMGVSTEQLLDVYTYRRRSTKRMREEADKLVEAMVKEHRSRSKVKFD